MLTKEQQEKLYQDIGGMVKAQRLKSGISQDELAKHLGFISRISVTHIENGKQKVQLHTLMEICDFFKIPVNSLLPALESLRKNVAPQVVKKINKEMLDAGEMEKVKDFYLYSITKNKA